MKHASIIPLIGGETLAAERAMGSPPEFIVSWEAFKRNDEHLLAYYDKRGVSVPYHLLDGDSPSKPSSRVDSVSSVCPCAGLSLLSTAASPDNPLNEWMVRSAEYVLGELKPAVYWGENAFTLATDMGKPVRDRLRLVARRHGYSMSTYRTKSLKHGVPQIRERSFYFFWRGSSLPVLEWYDRPARPIEEVILSATGNTCRVPIRAGAASDDPMYGYVLSELLGTTHRKFSESIEKTERMFQLITTRGKYPGDAAASLRHASAWMRERGHERTAATYERVAHKIENNLGYMVQSVTVPKGFVGAFVAHQPYVTTHPVEDRFLDAREAMTIMGLPQDFELIEPEKRLNHVCQNVPLETALDIATEVAAALDGKRHFVEADFLAQNNLKRETRVGEEISGDRVNVEDLFK